MSTVPPSLDIIVPVYNEEDSIDEFMARMRRLGYAEALLFVDNASTDGTVERIRRSDARLVRHTRNEGYGASIRDGIVATSGEGYKQKAKLLKTLNEIVLFTQVHVEQ